MIHCDKQDRKLDADVSNGKTPPFEPILPRLLQYCCTKSDFQVKEMLDQSLYREHKTYGQRSERFRNNIEPMRSKIWKTVVPVVVTAICFLCVLHLSSRFAQSREHNQTIQSALNRHLALSDVRLKKGIIFGRVVDGRWLKWNHEQRVELLSEIHKEMIAMKIRRIQLFDATKKPVVQTLCNNSECHLVLTEETPDEFILAEEMESDDNYLVSYLSEEERADENY